MTIKFISSKWKNISDRFRKIIQKQNDPSKICWDLFNKCLFLKNNFETNENGELIINNNKNNCSKLKSDYSGLMENDRKRAKYCDFIDDHGKENESSPFFNILTNNIAGDDIGNKNKQFSNNNNNLDDNNTAMLISLINSKSRFIDHLSNNEMFHLQLIISNSIDNAIQKSLK